MRKSVKLISALSVAGLAVVAGSAFTASNTLPDGGVSGYGQSVATGATITSITHTLLASDNSKLASVTFISSTDLTVDDVASMTLKDDGTVVGSPYTCSIDAATETITCATADNPLLSAFDTTGLTVL